MLDLRWGGGRENVDESACELVDHVEDEGHHGVTHFGELRGSRVTYLLHIHCVVRIFC